MEGKYLITTDNWFFAPDGKQYKSVWGNVRVLGDNETLDIITNRNGTNWFVKIGSEDKHVIIAGCQIHYACKCDYIPNIEDVADFDGIIVKTRIYIAE